MSSYLQIGVLFLIMIVGFYCRKRDIINEEINKGLSSFLINITLPLLILESFNIEYDETMAKNMIVALAVSFIAFVLTIICANLFCILLKGSRKDAVKFVIIFSNCGFMGFPVIEGIFGREGIIYASIFAQNFNKEQDFSALSVFLSTLISIITIPLILKIIT